MWWPYIPNTPFSRPTSPLGSAEPCDVETLGSDDDDDSGQSHCEHKAHTPLPHITLENIEGHLIRFLATANLVPGHTPLVWALGLGRLAHDTLACGGHTFLTLQW